ncbi:DUF4105 domain-containing protein [Pusillimonas sp. CC-YST705]|uniref:DUF4105 domain-containing protein n=1 Tax=Mesopusillimonas faecipullorum TaxID=2755040 RepID=A0ABS8CCV8_9BURK|nr:DUF4105 domain-containing protein [Mesopusillimonas faecipullorum]MCB5363876.1 DUF4105 domain-containing protein [Mesopusillimonas faecipullorum]
MGFLLAGWAFLALWFQASSPWRIPALVLCVLIGVATMLAPWLQRRKRIWCVAAVGFVATLAWWQTLQPSHDRVWADDVARLMHAEVEGNTLRLHEVRNFEWRSETDYTPRWETREYDLNELVSGDLFLSYWMGPAIAHTLVSFGFADGRQLVFSLEIRKEKGESFSAIAGFFRQYEVVLIAADENDIIRTRTNARGETVHMYRLNMPPAALREALLGYVREGEQIRREPRFYNSLTSNCTTIVFDLARQIAPSLPLDYRLLLSGYFAEYAFDQDGLTPGLDFQVLEQAGNITERARAFTGTPEAFPAAIRVGVPGVQEPPDARH